MVKGAKEMTTEYPQKMIPANALQLGDTIKAFDDVFGWAIVIRVSDNDVTLFRPYATTADFSYTGGVIAYIGLEQYSVPRNKAEFFVAYRRALA
jgi:hypothetical protein